MFSVRYTYRAEVPWQPVSQLDDQCMRPLRDSQGHAAGDQCLIPLQQGEKYHDGTYSFGPRVGDGP